MAQAFIDPLIGVVDGLNTLFQTPRPYISGSVTVFVNGIAALAVNDDGWTESSDNISITLKEAPRVGDVPSAYYKPKLF